ncbi:hypothetical protein GW17_00057314 [Ensete ventricosum]|nr:hypothetical protein GW17_00057314 [Ensete ventricosum]
MGSFVARSPPISPSPSPSPTFPTARSLLFLRPFPPPSPTHRRGRRRFRRMTVFRASSSSAGDGSVSFTWENFYESLRRGSARFTLSFREHLKKETGFDLESANATAAELVERTRDAAKKGRAAVDQFRSEWLPEFWEWNKWENWKDLRKWEPRRIGALILYIIVVSISSRKFYVALTSQINRQSKRELTEAYMEALIPEPSPANVRR